jgi:hypothetical protein
MKHPYHNFLNFLKIRIHQPEIVVHQLVAVEVPDDQEGLPTGDKEEDTRSELWATRTATKHAVDDESYHVIQQICFDVIKLIGPLELQC